jgi:uracil-DNA glycosylase
LSPTHSDFATRQGNALYLTVQFQPCTSSQAFYLSVDHNFDMPKSLRYNTGWLMEDERFGGRILDSADDETVEEAIATLHDTIRTCPLCPLSASRTHAVPGEGDLQATVMFIGEGPGEEEDKQGRPFVGRSGQFLVTMLAKHGIQRGDVFITNIVKCRPPKNRDPQSNEIEACSGYLDRQIELINPRIIVTLGRFSMQRWFPGGAITKIHGQTKDIGQGRIAMPLFHPAAALRNPAWRTEFEIDIAKLADLIEQTGRPDTRA